MDFDYDSTDDEPEDNYIPNAESVTMTIDGVQASDSLKLPNLESYSLCDICDKYYAAEMIDTTENTFIKCKHCWFFLKYEEFTSSEMTDLQKTNLSNYINAYANKHNSAKCTKKSDMGGCFLCEHNAGIILDCKLEVPSNTPNTTNTTNNIQFGNGIADIKPGQKFVLTV